MRMITDVGEGLSLVARDIQSLFTSGESITRATLNTAMERAFGANDATGAWTQRQSFDALEAAVSLWLMQLPKQNDPKAELAAITAMVAQLPTQTVRSEAQYQLQQFSTPADIAWLAAHLAAIISSDIVLEPSAGTGVLAAFAKRAGASLQLNEYDPIRAPCCARSFQTAMSANMMVPGSPHCGRRIPDPPFSSSTRPSRYRWGAGKIAMPQLAIWHPRSTGSNAVVVP